MCGPCWAAHGGKPDASEIGPVPVETAPLRYPTDQRQWLAAVRRAEWVQAIRVDGRRNLLAIARHLMLAGDWTTLQTMPGWDVLQRKTGLSETSLGRWIQEMKLHGHLVVLETGSTPATRPMALTAPAGVVPTRLDEGNRRAVYALLIPQLPEEALRRATDTVTTPTAEGAAQEPLSPAAGGPRDTASAAPDTGRDQGKPAAVGDIKGRPTLSFPVREKTWGGGYAREASVVDNSPRSSSVVSGPPPTDALRARLDENPARIWAVRVPSSGFEMLIAAGWLQARLPVFAQLTRKGARAAVRPYWAAGWSNLDIVHAMDHLPAAFGTRAGTQIGRGPADRLDSRAAWWWIQTRLDPWRHPDDGRVRTGYYQTRRRRKAIRDALAARHGRAALAVLGEVDLTADPVLTPAKIAAFGRRVAAQLRAQTDPTHPAAPAPTPAPVSSERTRADAAGQLAAELAARRARQVAADERHAAMMANLAPHLQTARAELAAATGATAAGTAPTAGATLTPAQRYEAARARAAGYRRARRLATR